MRSISFLRKLSANKNFWPILAIMFFAWLSMKPLFGSGYFNMHDDLQMMRQLEMEKCFMDFQIPCRWVPDMGYGFGYPLFNFYPPLPYLVGQVFRVIGYSFVDTAKALFILSLGASGVTMYFFGKRFFGRIGGTLASIFYMWAPYHAVDIYVRGAMNEAWGLIWFPLILLFSYNLILLKAKKIEAYIVPIVLLALSWFALFTSHNLMVIVFTPFFAVWCALWLLYYKNWKAVLTLGVGGAFSFGLAAFFTLPVFLEKDIVQTGTLVRGYYEFTAHFPSAAQLLVSRFWGYGPSVWMAQDDKMSFQIGWLHWIIPLVVVLLLARHFLKNRKLSPFLIATSFMIFMGWAAAFMAHPRSTPVWNSITEFQFIQFPWRYLTMVILGFSFGVGAIACFVSKFKRGFLFFGLAIAAVLYSLPFFTPENNKLGPITDDQKFSGVAWEMQQTAGIYDYLPNTAFTAPKAPRTQQADIISGSGEIHFGESGTNWEKFSVTVKEPLSLRINVMDFPEWKVFVDGNEVETYIPEKEEWGRIYIDVPEGEHQVYAKLYDTQIRTLGNAVSALCWTLLILLLAGLYIRNSKKTVLRKEA